MGERVACVFRMHRLTSMVIGSGLLFAPEHLVNFFGAPTPLTTPFRITLQSWACFIIAVSMVVHVAIDVPLANRRAIATCVLVCFGLLTLLYGHCLYTNDLDFWQGDMKEYRVGIASCGGYFVGFWFAYFWALATDPPGPEGGFGTRPYDHHRGQGKRNKRSFFSSQASHKSRRKRPVPGSQSSNATIPSYQESTPSPHYTPHSQVYSFNSAAPNLRSLPATREMCEEDQEEGVEGAEGHERGKEPGITEIKERSL